MSSYETIEGGRFPIYAWTRGLPVEEQALEQLRRIASLPFIHRHVAVMPDVHLGKGATVGSVIPTVGAIVPAAVGVDIGCGMVAARTSLTAVDLPESLAGVRSAIEAAVPHGRTHHGGRGDRGAWGRLPDPVALAWRSLAPEYERLVAEHPRMEARNSAAHLGTLGTGNHFIELCLDEAQRVWILLHSGSRGPGNRIGVHFIELAKKEMERTQVQLPDADLAYLPEGSKHFDAYVRAVGWAQDYASVNRRLMLDEVIAALEGAGLPPFTASLEAIDCHHNYVARERHFGREVWITRKGAVRAGLGEMGIIPGSMGARSFIVRGKGNRAAFETCSHGAGRVMSRGEARRRITLEEHARATSRVECRRDAGVLDESPAAYKDIEAVMAAQADLVDVVHVLEQVVCVKG